MIKRIVLLNLMLMVLLPAALKAQKQPFETIMSRVFEDNAVNKPKQADAPSIKLFGKWKEDGSWSDINYQAKDITKWQPSEHLDRLKTIINAYTDKSSTFYGNPQIFAKIQHALEYWYNQDPKSDNWWHNEIDVPQKIGELLISLRYGTQKLPKALESELVERMKRGSAEEKTGANKTDIALHYLYRALLTEDKDLLKLSLDQLFEPVALVDGAEGLQYDYSYLQHGPQLYISGYGAVYLTGIVKVSKYVAGTSFAMSKEKLDLFSTFYRNVYLKTFRSKYIDFNVEGRGVSRKDILIKKSEKYRINNAKLIDAKNAEDWENIRLRVDSTEAPDYKVTPYHQHFWKADYTLHVRPNYSFNVRIASNRTNRSEAGNKENLYGRYLSDGATNIQVSGPEYFNIMPVWEWDKIPGTTSVDNTEDLLLDKFWGHLGDNAFAGGVSDKVYGATAYQLEYDGVSAKKSWFFFDDEIVCLGADIRSSGDRNVTTTLNQAWLKGKVSSSVADVKQGALENMNFTANGWLFHDGVAYLFPNAAKVNVSTQVQTGSWYKINNSFGKEEVSGSVFKSWLDHGKQPQGADYAYIVLPGLKDAGTLKKYNNPIEIVRNDKDVQAVYHKKLNLVQVVFYSAGTVAVNGIDISVDKPTVLMLKALKGNEKEVLVADPLQKETALKVSLKNIKSGVQKDLSIALPVGPYKGSTKAEKVSL